MIELIHVVLNRLTNFDPDDITVKYLKDLFSDYSLNFDLVFDIAQGTILKFKIDKLVIRLDYDREIVIFGPDFVIRWFSQHDSRFININFNDKYITAKEAVQLHKLDAPENFLKWNDDDLLMLKMVL